MSLSDLRTAIEFAPVWVSPGPDGLIGWRSADVVICERCAARISARGCGYLLHGFVPVWDQPVTCATCTKGGEP